MTKKEALKTFAKYIQKPCPICKKPAGELCDTPGVWVHLERMEGKS